MAIQPPYQSQNPLAQAVMPQVEGNAPAPSNYEMLCMRMRWPFSHGRAAKPPKLDHAHIHQTKDRVLIFIVNNGEHVVLEDDPNMFPSDTLVAQIRVLEG